TGARSGAVTVADKQQAEERLFAAQAQQVQFRQELANARIRFQTLVGAPLENYIKPPRLGRKVPPSVSGAINVALTTNPAIEIATAEIDAAAALLKQAKSAYFPKVTFEGSATDSEDVDGVLGREIDLRAEIVARWNIFNGGADSANKQEQIRRVDEARFGLEQAQRDVEEAVRLSWEARLRQRERLGFLQRQLAKTIVLIESYEEQFKIGGRSLLDLLDTQRSKFGSEVSVSTAEAAADFSVYRILASMGVLLDSLGISSPENGFGEARWAVRSPPTPYEDQGYRRREPVIMGISNWQSRVFWGVTETNPSVLLPSQQHTR
ncbi:MAG: TolC family protein, partial [Hyphomicrobiaceae bacterium]